VSDDISLRGRRLPILTPIALLFLASACSSPSGGIKAPESLPSGPSLLADGSRVGAVSVLLDEEKLTPKMAEVARLNEVPRILQNRVVEQFATRGMSGEGNLDVKVEVIGMRLRSNGTAIWWGMMAGGDWITVDVDVSRDGRSIKNFQTGTGTSLGGFAYGARSTRVGRMMKTLSERIADGI